MYISRAEQRKVFVDCLKHYSLFFIYLLGLTIFEYVIFVSPRNEFYHNMLRVAIVLYGIAHLYLVDVSAKVEKNMKISQKKDMQILITILFYYFALLA